MEECIGEHGKAQRKHKEGTQEKPENGLLVGLNFGPKRRIVELIARTIKLAPGTSNLRPHGLPTIRCQVWKEGFRNIAIPDRPPQD